MKKKASAKTFGVIGLGRFGMALAMTLAKGGKDVIVIDENESKVRETRPYTDYAFVTLSLIHIFQNTVRAQKRNAGHCPSGSGGNEISEP